VGGEQSGLSGLIRTAIGVIFLSVVVAGCASSGFSSNGLKVASTASRESVGSSESGSPSTKPSPVSGLRSGEEPVAGHGGQGVPQAPKSGPSSGGKAKPAHELSTASADSCPSADTGGDGAPVPCAALAQPPTTPAITQMGAPTDTPGVTSSPSGPTDQLEPSAGSPSAGAG
jgi:hypothetical protein